MVCLYCQLLILSQIILTTDNNTKMSNKEMIHVDFEVFGKVQGVFFRKYTQKQAKVLPVRGWCMNTENGTVQGQIEGIVDKVNDMKKWLQFKGSPASRVEKVDFRNERKINKYSFDEDFKIRR